MITEAWVRRFESLPIDSQASVWSKLSSAEKTKVRALAKTLKKKGGR